MIALRIMALAIALCGGGSGAQAADLDVEVRDADGTPVEDAVVTIHYANIPMPAAGGNYAIDQQNIQFQPFVTVVPVGARVSFLNHDPVRHQVYSFSTAKRFELKLEKRQQDRTVVFDKRGIVPLGCNIHDSMIAFIDVVDTPWAAKTDSSGHAVLRGLPVVAANVDIWHPYLRSIGNHLSRTVSLSGGMRREIFTVTLRAPPRPSAQSDY